MANAPGPIKRAWYEWKMLRFPWRKKWLVGFDLHGNTFWEFKDALHSLRNRRIAKYHRSTHYGDVNVSPSWMQWLRHTRFEPPTLHEQRADLQRQANIKLLAARADERWAAKPSALDAPDRQQPVHMLESRDPAAGVVQPDTVHDVLSASEVSSVFGKEKKKMKKKEKKLPATTNPGDDWQPQSWSPPPRRR